MPLLTKPGGNSLPTVCVLLAVQAQRRSREHSRSASALSISGGDEKSEPSEGVDQHLSYYSNGGFFTSTTTGRRTNLRFIRGQTVPRPPSRTVLVTASNSFGQEKVEAHLAKRWAAAITDCCQAVFQWVKGRFEPPPDLSQYLYWVWA